MSKTEYIILIKTLDGLEEWQKKMPFLENPHWNWIGKIKKHLHVDGGWGSPLPNIVDSPAIAM